MHREIKDMCKICLNCQESKVSRHVSMQPVHFTAPDARFQHVHIDLIGPMTNCDGYLYCLTLIDRFSRWAEAIPLKIMTAETVSRAFFDNWISRYGAPRTVTTCQGAQFESQLFKALLSLIGCERIRTTAYHPAANGMIERWYRALKAAIMCHNDRNWVRQLFTVLLGLRTHVRTDTGASPAEYLYETTLRIPGEFCLDDDFTPDPQIFLEEFREHMRKIKPVPVTHRHKKRAFFFKDLRTCTHVFLRVAAIKQPLERPYTGPHKVLERTSSQVYKIDFNGSPRSVSTELLKPAHFIPVNLAPAPHPHAQPHDPPAEPSRLKTYQKKKVRLNLKTSCNQNSV